MAEIISQKQQGFLPVVGGGWCFACTAQQDQPDNTQALWCKQRRKSLQI